MLVDNEGTWQRKVGRSSRKGARRVEKEEGGRRGCDDDNGVWCGWVVGVCASVGNRIRDDNSALPGGGMRMFEYGTCGVTTVTCPVPTELG